MKIVIEISSYDKEWITNGYYIPEEINVKISEAIANSTLLPEGHGRIVDIGPYEGKVIVSSIYCEINNPVEVAKLDTIIEADKENEE